MIEAIKRIVGRVDSNTSPTPTRSRRDREPSRRSLFKAAEGGPRYGDWKAGGHDINAALRASLTRIRARSRDAAVNNALFVGYLLSLSLQVLGANGVKMQSKAVNLAGQADDKLATSIEGAFDLMSFPSVCDVSGRLGWVEFQRLTLLAVATDGEAFIRKHYDTDGRLRLELVNADRVDVDLNDTRPGGRVVIMGIELDRAGQRIAYHLRDRVEELSPLATGRRAWIRVPADEMIHVYRPQFPNQLRGIPWAAPVLASLKMLDGYEDASLTKARASAAIMGFIYTDDGASYATPDGDGLVPPRELAPGVIEELADGQRFEGFDPQYPTGEFDAFTKAIKRNIAAAFGVSYPTVARDLEGVNYSSIRAGVLEERELWKALQAWFIDSLHRPVFEAWLGAELIAGRIVADGHKLDARDLPRCLPVAWQPRRWAWVDPQKDTASTVAALEAGIKSPSEVAREQGRDFDELVAEIARDRAKLREAGVTVAEVVA